MTKTTGRALAEHGADTVRGTAKFLGTSERHVYRLIDSGELRAVRSGRRVLIPRAAARAYLRRLLDDTPPPAPDAA